MGRSEQAYRCRARKAGVRRQSSPPPPRGRLGIQARDHNGKAIYDETGKPIFLCAGSNGNTGEPCLKQAKISGLCTNHFNVRVVQKAKTPEERKRLSKKRDKVIRRAERERRRRLAQEQRARFIAAGIRDEDLHPDESSADSDEQFREPARLSLPRRR